MALDATILTESRTGLITGSGYVTGTELRTACLEMISAPSWEPGFDEIWDLSDAHQIDVSPEELEALVTSTRDNADRIGRNRVVVVTKSDSVAVLVRLYRQLTGALGRTHCTVRTRDDADAWLAGDDSGCM